MHDDTDADPVLLAQPLTRGNHAATEEINHNGIMQPPSSREALDTLLDKSLAPLEALLSAAHPLNALNGGPSTSSLITAADSVVASLSVYKGPWLQPSQMKATLLQVKAAESTKTTPMHTETDQSPDESKHARRTSQRLRCR